jgi:hypothetical protein
MTVAGDSSFKSKKQPKTDKAHTTTYLPLLSFYNQLQPVKRAHTQQRGGIYYLQQNSNVKREPLKEFI